MRRLFVIFLLAFFVSTPLSAIIVLQPEGFAQYDDLATVHTLEDVPETGITLPLRATAAWLEARGGCIEYAYDDATDLTTTDGHRLCDGERLWVGRIEPVILSEVRFLEIDAAASLKVSYFSLTNHPLM